MKPMLVLLACGSLGGGTLIRADEPPAAAKQEEPGATPGGFGRGRGRGQWSDPRFIEDRHDEVRKDHAVLPKTD